MSATTTTSAAPSRWTSDEQAVIDAYAVYVVAVQDAAVHADAMHPALVRSATGALLTSVREAMAEEQRSGIGARRPQPSATGAVPISVAIDGDVAHLVSCDVDDTIVYRTDTAEVLNDAVETRRSSARLVRLDGVWKVIAREAAGEAIEGDEVDRCIAGA